MSQYIYAIISVAIVSLISLLGVLTLQIKVQKLKQIMIYFISFSAGSMFAGVFLHMLPEIVKEIGFTTQVSMMVLLGIIISFILEKIIHWRHCHMPVTKTHIHHVGIMSLTGDAMHNFIDGIIIGVSFLVDTSVGMATTFAVIFHEIPQEIADFGILIHSGFSKKKALLMNFLISLFAFLGLAIALMIGTKVENLIHYAIPIAAGNFIYIAGADMIPELHKETKLSKSLIQLLSFIAGIAIMYLMLLL